MNNKEKREYINCLALLDQNCFISEIQKRNEVLSKSPNILYKYRQFDKYAFEMIKNNYAYLSPVKDLDDPFDCVSDFDLNSFMNKNTRMLKSQFIDYVIKSTAKNLTKKQLEDYKKTISPCLSSDGLNFFKVSLELQKFGISKPDADKLINLYSNCQNIFDAYEETKTFVDFANVAYKPDEVIGVCSLSENRDNKVMWSLYGKQYKGYCIEYEIPYTKEARKTLYPVLYSRKISNNFVKRMFDTIWAQLMRNINNDLFINKDLENVGAIYEPFCLKDTDWKYQQEWRVIGKAEDHFEHFKIKAIYLGFKVAKTNENRMVSYAKRYGFDLYKMNKSNGKKKIRYSKLI